MMDTPTLRCQVLPASFIDEAATVLADAFSDSPAYNYIFQHDQEYRQHALEWLFRRNLPLVHKRCPTALRGVLNEQGEVVAAFLWTPSPHHDISTWDMVVAGLWQIPYRFGLATLMRLTAVVDAFKADNYLYGREEDFVILERMSVRSDYRGKGLGTMSIKAAIGETDRIMRLTTQEERNVRLYKRLGFKVVGEVDHFRDSPYKYHAWFMVREP